MFAYANSLANVAGFLGPMTVSWIVKDRQDSSSWSNLFFLSAAIFFACGLLFCFLAENHAQDFGRKPTLGGRASSISQACLAPAGDIEKTFKMDAFQRLGREPRESSIIEIGPSKRSS